MLVLDDPYISSFLLKTVEEENYPVFYKGKNINKKNKEIDYFSLFNGKEQKLYTNSENSIGWIEKNLKFTNYPNYIKSFKNKSKFRDILKKIYPNFFYKEIKFSDIDRFDIDKIDLPIVLKPSIGFMSIGVYKIFNREDWFNAIKNLKLKIEDSSNIYPKEVFDKSNFILEELIDGDEFAFDTYFNKSGESVILGIYQHLFSSDVDVSDRIYLTSKNLIESNIDQFYVFMEKLSQTDNYKNLPLHIEVKKSPKHGIIPIEVNVLRFGGWCTTPDISNYAYNFNQYNYYFQDKKPNWDKIFDYMKDDIYSIIILDNSTKIDLDRIKNFNKKKFINSFENILEFREIDFKKYSVFGIAFAKTGKNNFKEIKNILKSDLKEFIELKNI